MGKIRLALFALGVIDITMVSHAADRDEKASDPELFAPGTISTQDDEFGITFEPDEKNAYFTKRSPTTNTPPRSVICVTQLNGQHWGEPQIASFSGVYNDFGVTVSVDGRRIIFSSDRPIDGSTKSGANVDLWEVEKIPGGWSEPRNLGAVVNSAAIDAYPTLAGDGTLYFASNRSGGAGGMDLYRSRFENGSYTAPENLASLNSAASESQPAIAPDQSFIIFASTGRADAQTTAGAPYPRADLYASAQTNDGWTSPVNLGAPINSADNDSAPSISPSGKWFFFASDRGFVSIPMSKPLTAAEFEHGVHGILNGWNNIYQLPISTVTSQLKLVSP